MKANELKSAISFIDCANREGFIANGILIPAGCAVLRSIIPQERPHTNETITVDLEIEVNRMPVEQDSQVSGYEQLLRYGINQETRVVLERSEYRESATGEPGEFRG